jgi:MFS family permease
VRTDIGSDPSRGTQATRRLATRYLFASVAAGSTGFVASITVTPLVGKDLTGSATLAGLPWAAGVLGTGLGSAALSQLIARRGRGAGLILGYLIGAAGFLAGIGAVVAEVFPLFVVAVLLMGVGNSANHLSRYAAADIYPAEQRASGLSMVVWAGTIGGVAGPALLEPSGRAARAAGLPSLTGAFVVAAIGFLLAMAALASLTARRPDALRPDDGQVASTGRGLFELWKVPSAQVALIALAVAQTVMVMIMAMTPLHMRSMGHGLSSVGVVISVHVFGMYGLSPISGRLADRFGPTAMILAGFATLAAAAVGAAISPHTAGLWLTIPLFLLGFGWSLTFVAGSALLTRGLSFGDRARLQGGTDSIVWTAAAIAGLSSGILVEAFSYALLCLVGALLIVGPVVTVAGRRRVLAAA